MNSLFLSWGIHFLLPTDDKSSWFWGLCTLGLISAVQPAPPGLQSQTEVTPAAPSLLRLSLRLNYTTIFPVLQLTVSYCGTSQPPALCESIYILNLLYLTLYVLIVLFLWRNLLLYNFKSGSVSFPTWFFYKVVLTILSLWQSI